MAFTDIRFDLVQHLPANWRPYALLLRLDRPVGWWLLLLPGWWGIALAAGGFAGMGPREWGLMALFLAGAVVMRGAGCVVNDLWDRDLDRAVERTRQRPLASGAIAPRRALAVLAALLGIGLLILLQTTPLCIVLGIAVLPLIAAYPYMKRITWWPQAFLGLTFNFGVLMGWAAVTGELALPAFLLYAGGVFWTLGYDTIYAHQDRDDDALAGIKSTARLFGERSKIWVGEFYAVGFSLIFTAVWAAASGPWTVAAVLPAAFHMAWQLARWDMSDPHSSLRVFRSNRDFGLLVILGIFITTF